MTQIIPSIAKNQNDNLDKDAKSIASTSQRTLGMMHDYHNNTYHSSYHNHYQSQPSRRHNSSSAPPTGLISSASCGSPFPFATTAEPARPNSTPNYYRPHLMNQDQDDDIDIDIDIDVDIDIDDDDDDDDDDNDNDNESVHDIDYNSLFEAMNDSPCLNPTANQHHLLQTTDGQDSFDTMLSYLRKNDDLVQHMDTIEQLENISFLRVMYLGVNSAEERRLFLKKLSDGLSESFFRQTPAPSLPHDSTTSSSTASSDTNNNHHSNSSSKCNNTPPSYGFRERRHHLLPLHLFFTDPINDNMQNSKMDDDDDDDDDGHAAMFEENGVSIVEADFTTDNNNNHRHQYQHRHDPELVLHYIYTQCQQSHSPTSLKSILNPPAHWENQPFNGHVFSEGTPGGIDLCVYFYHDAQGVVDVIKDMDLLWKINALHIPILPIMSMSNQVLLGAQTVSSPHSINLTSTSLSDNDNDNNGNDDNDDDDYSQHTTTSYLKQRSIDVRRTELAHIFSQWRIKMMDISNLDIIGQPSFQQKGSSRRNSTLEDRMIEQRLGQAWASSSIVSPTPYHILTLFQFVAMDRWAVSKLLKTIMDQAEERRHPASQSIVKTTPSPPPPVDNTPSDFHHNKQHLPTCEDIKESPSPFTSSLANMVDSIIRTVSSPDSTKSISSSTSSTSWTLPPPSHHQGLRLLYLLPFLILAAYGLWISLTSMVTRQTSSPWHASLVMVSHQGEKSMTLMVNVYDGQDQPRWAPQPPLITTNLPVTKTASTTIVSPLPNKTHSLEGQYFYSIRLPRCTTLDPTTVYTIQVMASANLPRNVQGSPLQIPRYVLCDPSSSSFKSDEQPIMEAWYHFRQHTRFYLRNSAKIVEMIFTEGKEKD